MPVDNIGLEEAVAGIWRGARAGVRGYMATPNVDHVVLYRQDPAFAPRVWRLRCGCSDGGPLVVAVRLLGRGGIGRCVDQDRLPSVTMLLRRQAVERVGEYDERLGAGVWSGEETDYLLGALEAGYVLHCPEVTVGHPQTAEGCDRSGIACRYGLGLG